MNRIILNKEIQAFINNNLDSNLTDIILKGIPFDNVDVKEIVEQIESKSRSEKKLPTWFKQPNIYYPNKLNIEQTSSEITAAYKSSIIEGNSIIDLTGGFGVDCFYLSKKIQNVLHCEIDENLSEIAKHNFQQLNVGNIKTVVTDGIQFLENHDELYDWIYVDPSRRHDQKGKVFFLKDCAPNLVDDLNILFSRSENIMVKTSPLLDISIGIEELKYVKTIHIVAINNEVKELLWILQKNYNSEIEIKTINIQPKTTQTFHFKRIEELNGSSSYSQPHTYLYEPNAAILKAGAFNSLCNQLNILKLNKHSHLYTSETLLEFPGRQFQIERVIPYKKKQLKSIGIGQANITTRNFPETVQYLRKTLKIKEGGSNYLFFTTNINNEKIVIVCSKIS